MPVDYPASVGWREFPRYPDPGFEVLDKRFAPIRIFLVKPTKEQRAEPDAAAGGDLMLAKLTRHGLELDIVRRFA